MYYPFAGRWLTVLFVSITARGFAQPGHLDLGFNTADPGYGPADPMAVKELVLQSDGRVIISSGQDFDPSWMVVRLDAAGEADSTFQSFPCSFGRALAVLPDDRILVGSYGGVHRLMPDGAPDPSFTFVFANGNVNDIAVDAMGRILVCGDFSTYGGVPHKQLARLLSDGSVDAGFSAGSGFQYFPVPPVVHTVCPMGNGKIVVGGMFTSANGTPASCLVALNADGSVSTDMVLAPVGFTEVFSLAEGPDGKLLAGGYRSPMPFGLFRFNADGTQDMTFDPPDPAMTGPMCLATDAGGGILVGGTNSGAPSCPVFMRLLADGPVDPAFPTFPILNADMRSIRIAADGSIVTGGRFSCINGTSSMNVARWDADGTGDASFHQQHWLDDNAFYMALHPDGDVLVAGRFKGYEDACRPGLIKVDPFTGALDPDYPADRFDPGQYSPTFLHAMADGKLMIGGAILEGQDLPYLFRLQADGSLDPSFDIGPPAANSCCFNDLVELPDGRMVICGDFTQVHGVAAGHIACLMPNGDIDPSFQTGTGFSTYNCGTVATRLRTDGKVLVYVGCPISYNGAPLDKELVVMNMDGSLNPTFDIGSGPEPEGSVMPGLAMTSDDALYVGGSFQGFNGVPIGYLVHLHADGSVDDAFNADLDGAVRSLMVQPDGKLIVCGDFMHAHGDPAPGFVRLLADGTVDASFDPGSGPDPNGIICMQPTNDGALIVGGAFTSYNGVGRSRLARVLTDFPTAITPPARPVDLQVHPQPADASCAITIAKGDGPVDITFLDNAGRVVCEERRATNADHVTLDTARLPCGHYIVQARSGTWTGSGHLVIAR